MPNTFFICSHRIMHLYNSLFRSILKKHQLSQLKMDILLFLANDPSSDTADNIVEKCYLTKSNISVSVDALVLRGLLSRIRLDNNRKIIHLCPTNQATPIIAEGCTVQKDFEQIIFKGFSDQELKQFSHFMKCINRNVDEALACSNLRSLE